MATRQTDSTKIELILQEMGYIKSEVKEIKETLKKQYVTATEHIALKDRVKLLERAVYGFITLVLVLVLTAIVGGVIIK